MSRLMRASPLALERSITLHQLRVFKAVADNLSFSAAAHDLRLSQPSVSYQVKELERAVGMDLLDRLGKHVELTQAGHLLYGYDRQTLNVIDEAAVALGELQGLWRWGPSRSCIPGWPSAWRSGAGAWSRRRC
ncbi:MAG: LysR family transcriptional regulator [Chloroflexi bacterium]|nr:MAG: LysR family transcriptional regulator [Chloroflexota bacterium]